MGYVSPTEARISQKSYFVTLSFKHAGTARKGAVCPFQKYPTAPTAPSLSLPTAHAATAKPVAEVLSSPALTELCRATRGELHAWPDAEPPVPTALSKCLRGFGKLHPRERGRQSSSWGTGVRAGARSCPSLLTVLSSNLSAACVHRTLGAYGNIAGICQAPVRLERSAGRSPISLTNSKNSIIFFL